MIRLSRLNHRDVAINCDLIEWVEANPDTTVRLVSGETLIVLETPDEVIRRIEDYRRRLLASAGLATLLTSGERPSAALLHQRDDGEPSLVEATLPAPSTDEGVR